MAPKSKEIPDESSSYKNLDFSTDDWLERKRKSDGAEGLWRIHDKLYDLTLWSRTHPGGKFWIDITRGTDITEAFETHHISDRAQSLLHNFYRRDAQTSNKKSVIFGENGFHRVFKQILRQQNLTLAKKSLLQIDALVAIIFLTALLGTDKCLIWTLLSGVLLGILSASCHDLFHMESWRVNYFNLSLMSARDWKIRHVLSHHHFRNTDLDLEIPIWQPLKLYLRDDTSLGRTLRVLLTPILFALSSHIQFLKRVIDVLLSRKLSFQPEELVAFSLPMFLFLFSKLSPWDVFINWSLIIVTGSFFFCSVSSIQHQSQPGIYLEKNTIRDDEDFGLLQLTHSGHPKNNLSVPSYLNSFRGNVLHYLLPGIDCGALDKLIPAFEETCSQLGVLYKKGESGFLDGCQNNLPQGHVFFS